MHLSFRFVKVVVAGSISVLTACSPLRTASSGRLQCLTLLTLYDQTGVRALTLTAQFDTTSDVRVLTTEVNVGEQTMQFLVKDCGGLSLKLVAHIGDDTLASVVLQKPGQSFRQWEAIARVGGTDPRKPPYELEGMAFVEAVPLKLSRRWTRSDTLWAYWVGIPQ